MVAKNRIAGAGYLHAYTVKPPELAGMTSLQI